MPTVDEVARSAKDNVQSSLTITHNLTLHPSSPSDFVLHRVNDVLGTVINNNFDAHSMDAVGALYAAIGEAQPHMVATAHDIALIHLSRSFAVVLENAITMKGSPTGSSVNNNNTSVTSGGAWSNAAPSGGFDSKQASSGSFGRPPMTSQTAGSVQPSKEPQPPQQQMSGGKAASTPAAAAFSTDVAAEAARRKKKEANRDYSFEAKEGRIRVYGIPTSVTEAQLKGAFQKYGDILELSYPLKHGKYQGFAFLKFKDNVTANKVCSQRIELADATLTMDRAKYWFKKDKKDVVVPVFGTGRANAGSGSGSGPFSKNKPVDDGDQSGESTAASSSLEVNVSSELIVQDPQNPHTAEKKVVDDKEEEDSDDDGNC